jgi:asparagine synthase (glutamine-hydrolysing)
MLREPFRSSCANIVEQEIGNHRPPPDPFAYRAEILEGHDPANLVGRALWKIDGRDPTADRDLVEFCFGLPDHLRVGPEGGRPLYELAFGDRLDPRQLRPIKRGYQAAVWDWVFTPVIVATRLRQSRRHPDVREVIDLDYADRLLASWPRRWPDLGTMLHYRNDLLGVVAAADFIAVNF